MKIQDIINDAINKSSFSKARIARLLGYSAQALNGRLMNTNSPKVNFTTRILDLVGYDLVVVPKGSNLPRGSYVVTNEDDKQ